MTPKQKRQANFDRKRPRPSGGQGFDRLLSRRIELSKNKCVSVDQLAVSLRSTYPEYTRHKLQPFIKRVHQILEQMDHHNNEEYDDERTHPRRKRPKKVEEAEEKLRLFEEQHTRKRTERINNDFESDAGSTCSMAPAASNGTLLESESDNSSEEDISTEDAIFEEKLEPKFDLMKSMLRDHYNEKSKKMGKEGEKEVANNVDKEVNLMNKRFISGNDYELLKIKEGNGLIPINNKNKDIRNNNSKWPLFKDLGGVSELLKELGREVVRPIRNQQLQRKLRTQPPVSGILLHGPPGCGKTELANAIANETGVPFYKVCATELVSGVSGTSEENIRELFSKARKTAPSIVFIDEIDAIATKRENLNRVMENQIVTQLMSCMAEPRNIVEPINGSGPDEKSVPGYVLVIGATNRLDSIDPSIRRPGRFDREIYIGVPDQSARVDILSVLTQNLEVEDAALNLLKIAKSTTGFVGADLVALTKMAGNVALNRIIDQQNSEVSAEPIEGEPVEECWRQLWSPKEIEKLCITVADFEEAAKKVQPSSTREGFSTIPSVKWEDVGGLQLIRDVFEREIVRRIKYPEDYEEIGVDFATGILLYGPPGCGKTLIAKAVASESGANFIHIKGPELLNKYVGESELAVRTMFSRARTASPCILFFDEVDALTTRRGQEGGWVVERLLNQLLIELDGADQRKGVYVIGATNRPEVMDHALLRPGRFGKPLFVSLPSPDERGLILTAVGRKKKIDANVDLMKIGSDSACKNFSGADLSALINEAAVIAVGDKHNLRNEISDGLPLTIKEIHFKRALEKISPSVSDAQIRHYELLSEIFKAA